MDNLRLILIFTLAFILMLLWQAWEQDYGQPRPQPVATQGATPGGSMTGSAELPSVPVATGEAPVMQAVEAVRSAKVEVQTDLYTLEIDTKGGSIVSLHLNDYPISLDTPDQKFHLLRPEKPNLFMAQSGLVGAPGAPAPTHETLFSATGERFAMAEGSDSLDVDLVWEEGGIRVTKRFGFQRGTYLVTVQQIVENGSGQAWTGREYRQLIRTAAVEEGADSQFLYTYTGGAIFSPEKKYEKISFEDMQEKKLDRDVTGGWIGILQHYFLSAWVPPAEQQEHFYTKVVDGERHVLGAYTPAVTLAPGTNHTFTTGFLAGPKLQDDLEKIAPGLDLTVDYGFLTIISKPIFWLMQWIHSVVGNWGWSIILLTVLIKAAFYKLSETSYKSMANMRKVGPRIQALKDRFGDDKQGMQQEMMRIYKEEKINPLGGCLPIVVQIPVFLALYWVLLESVELRQAPFMFWIKDLSIKDPYFVLPLIMGVSMFIQQKLNPQPPDPMQAKIMMMLPFVFTIFFAFFPAGLVLYWVVNNILSITQQWYITRAIEQAAARH